MGLGLDVSGHVVQDRAMPKINDANQLSWPWWAPWALIAVVVTSLLTIVATLYDIL